MSVTQRYKLEVKDSDAELVPCDFGSYVEYREHVKRIKRLEQELAEAKAMNNVHEESIANYANAV